jgi:hypothetical protein
MHAGDIVHGGGNDNFIFQNLRASPVSSRHDIIHGFTQGDHIDLSALNALVPGGQLTFIGGESFTQYHHDHHSVWGMVRDAHGQVQINTNHNLHTTEMAINVPHTTLHASDFIL